MMKSLKVIIVEDEAKARKTLAHLVNEFCEGVEIVGSCASVEEGVVAITDTKPDIVFLDIEMQTGSGFDLLERITDIDFEVIFTTAYEHYAVQAIKFSAMDYLLKPIDWSELKQAVEKVRSKREKDAENKNIRALLRNLQTSDQSKHIITLSTFEGYEFIQVNEIIRCEANGSYTSFFLKDNRELLVSKNLKEYANLLLEYNFFRVHQSHVVNLDEVRRYVRADGGYIEMRDGSQVIISQRHKEEFIKAMNRNKP